MTAWDPAAQALAEALLEAPGWDPARRGMRRRDATALRVMLGRELDHIPGPDGLPIDVDHLLRLWARFGQAVYDEDVDALNEPLGLAPGALTGWGDAVARTFGTMLERFPPPQTLAGARCRATFAVFVFAETVVFWEYSVVGDQVDAMRDALAQLAAGMPRGDAAQVRCAELVGIAVDLMTGLRRQLEVESATAACAVSAVREAAVRAREAMHAAEAATVDLWHAVVDSLPPATVPAPDVDARHTGIGSHLLALLALLRDDLAGTLPYFDLVADHIAPSSAAFLAGLPTRAHDEEIAAALEVAAQRCREFEESTAGQWSVFATETRAQRIPLETAAERCRDPELRTLELASAEVAYLYPFGLPVAATGVDVLPELMVSLGRADPSEPVPVTELAGARVVIDDAPRSDGWLASTSIQEADYRAFRAVFPDHELMVTTTDGVTLVGLDVDVHLSGMGNHYVRIRFGTDTRVEHRREDGRGDGGTLGALGALGALGTSGPWTPHDLEQAIRRGGQVGGVERVWLRARTPGSVDTAPVTSLLAFATRIVKDLATAAHRHEGSAQRDLERDLEVASGFLARYGQILVTVGQASAVRRGGGREPLTELPQLADLLGVQVALTPQRPLAQSPLEWVAYERPEESVRTARTLTGRIRRELIWCSGDVTAVFGPTAPHWQMLATQALVEFASSLIGVYWRRQQWLRRVVDDTGRLLDEPPEKSGIAAIEAEESRLAEAIRHVELLVDRANERRLSKDQQGRAVTQHLMRLNGVADLERSLGATLQAAVGTQRFAAERLALLREADRKRLAREREERAAQAQRRRQRPLEILLTVLAVLGLIDLFSWTNEAWGVSDVPQWWFVELGAILGAVVLVWWLGRRAWRESDRDD